MKNILISLLLAFSLQAETKDISLITKSISRGPHGHKGKKGSQGPQGDRGKRGHTGRKGRSSTTSLLNSSFGLFPLKRIDNFSGEFYLQFRTITPPLPLYQTTSTMSTTDGITEIDFSPEGYGWYIGQLLLNNSLTATSSIIIQIYTSNGSQDTLVEDLTFIIKNTLRSFPFYIPFLFKVSVDSPKLKINLIHSEAPSSRFILHNSSRLVLHKVGEPGTVVHS